MARITRSQGIERAFDDVFPVPIKATRAPTSSDTKFPLGQLWVRTDTAQVYILVQLSSGSASWTLASPGASDVDTMTGDSGGALSPTAGNMNVLGGTNMTVAGAGSTLTVNMDAAITLATSVSSPLYTVAAANDLAITAATGQDVVMKLGDNAAANKFSILDSDDVEVFAVDSNGGQTYTTITATGLITGQASATINTAGTSLTLAADNSGDAVILGGGTSARAITIGQDAAAHTVAIGQAAAGAITIDTAAGVSIDAATASNFSVSGASEDLTLASTAGKVAINAGEDAAQAIYLHANAGTSETIQLHADQGTGVSSIYLLSDAGGLTLEATGLASDDAINLVATAGGIDMDAALQVNIASSEDAADAIRISASAGGIDIDAVGEAGQDINILNTGGSLVLSATESANDAIVVEATAGGIDILASGAAAGEDIDMVATGSSINIQATEAAADAITINASDAAGGVDISTGGGDLDFSIGGAVNLDAAGAMSINSSAAAINIGDDAVAQAINIGTGAAARTITMGNTTGASALVLQSGTGEITVTGTVKEIDAEFLYASGTDLVVQQSPICQSNATTGAAPTGSNGDVNLVHLQDGCLMEQFIIGTQTIIAPRMTSNGLSIELDQTNAEGAEYNFGARNNAKHVYTAQTSDAFFAEATFYVEDYSGCAPLMMGFRKVEANNAVLADYTDYAAIGINQATSATNATILSELNGGGQTATDTTDALAAEPNSFKVGVFVAANGAVTFEVDGSAASAAPSYTFDSGDKVMFFIHFLNGADVAGEVSLVDLKIGYQA